MSNARKNIRTKRLSKGLIKNSFNYKVRKEIEQILEVCHIDIIGDIRFLTVEKMNDDEDLRKDFGLR